MVTFRTFSLQSGSCGNCIFVEGAGVRVLVDAGLSAKNATRLLRDHDVAADTIDAVLISHNHGDHSRSAGIFHRAFGAELFITRGTFDACENHLGRLSQVRQFHPGEYLQLGPLTVQTIPTPHDGVDGACFVFDTGCLRLGVLTDLGHVFPGLEEIVCSLDAVFLESNFDRQMLENGPYPHWLKRRVAGPGGHLSNDECASLLQKAFHRKLRWAALAHLSGENNSPDIALDCARRAVGDRDIHVARRDAPSPMLSL